MQKKTYEDYKYSMQDTSRLYVGSKYTMGELLEDEDILFKFRMIVERYILPESDLEDTLETHLYYLEKGKFLVQTYKHMKARVKVNLIEEKKNLLGKHKKEYVTRSLTIDELVEMPPEEKERRGLVIQELSVSKLALMGL
ncbi:MAG: hypothetical protein NC331_13105 [Lachnospiraceae bacterium]|nr:hypothetical protein [Lachnospiraceae bacterium]MCM1240303.1 hypothetical protein [Lachnospiraceae bacterium]MCM1305359.1 hypothetical protein [Butyrivibrio sp.]MCM1344729.1 hypothetical protein [Muribaculaceae bacterium]MCM1412012.1 hypothetical protein [Lachnospiraceae bacterium]